MFLVEFISRHFIFCAAVVNGVFSSTLSSNKLLCLYIRKLVSKFYMILTYIPLIACYYKQLNFLGMQSYSLKIVLVFHSNFFLLISLASTMSNQNDDGGYACSLLGLY